MKFTLPAILFAAAVSSTVAADVAPSDQLTPLSVPEAIAQLAGEDWLLQAEAMAAVERHGVRSVGPRLKEIHEREDRPLWLRGRALRALAQLNPQIARPLAEQRLDDADPQWRAAAVRALGALGEDADLKQIATILTEDGDATVRRAAMLSLARADAGHAWPHVQQAMKQLPDASNDPADMSGAETIAEALLIIDTPEADRALRQLLAHQSAAVRSACIDLVVRRQVDDAAALLAPMLAATRDEAERRQIRALLPQLPPDEVGAALLPLLSKRSTDADTFRTVLALIEDVLDRPLSDQLAEQLPVIAAQHGGEVRTVLSLLNRHGGTRHAGAVAELLDEKYPWYVQRDAVDALGEMRVDHFKLFKPLIATEHRYLRSSVLSVLSSKTKGAPEGGIVAYLRPVVALKGEDRSAVWAAMQLMASRISKDETAELVAVIRPMLGSSDREQREQAMQMLQRVAQGDIARHVAATQGFVTEWHLAGPFPSDRNNRGHHAAYPPERRVDLEAEYKGVNNLPVTWKSWRVTSVDGTAPLHKLMPLPVEYRTAYAVTRFDAPARQQVQVVVDADEGFKLWLNGGKVAEQFGRGSRAVLVPVREGRNELLIKVTNRKEWWQFSVKLLDPEGKALPWMLDATPVEAEDAEGD